ncbi:hypothetical protein V8F20_001301 [Naviculisporaceae sp. PSN 640]
MADVRALLRQQREARRVEHPHAAYSDAGKLLCTLCHEHIKTEALWDGHLRSAGHRQRLQAKASEAAKAKGNTQIDGGNGATGQSLKRKLDEDVEMGDAGGQNAGEDNIRKKRSKPDMTLGDLSPPSKKDDKTSTPHHTNNHKPITPPLTRRQSGTPTLGVEMQIPSRPATPGAMSQSAGSSGSTVTTPRTAGPFARSPLIHHDSSSLAAAAASASQALSSKPIPSIITTSAPSETIASTALAPVNEDEWAAFEADLLQGAPSKPAVNPKAILESSATISAPALSKEELAAKSEEEEKARRRAAADIQIEDEREEASRALETEFDVMEELEARARKLRERREALRLRGGTGAGDGVAAAAAPAAVKDTAGGGISGSSVVAAVGKAAIAALGKENTPAAEDVDDEDDDEDDIDDWAGFRFRS